MAAAYCWQKPTRLFKKSSRSLPDVPVFVVVLYRKWFAGLTKNSKMARAFSYSVLAAPTAVFTMLLTAGGTDVTWVRRDIVSGGNDSPATFRSAVVGWASDTSSV